MNEHLRQTGRTTRLIEKAVHEARAGRAVHILVAQSPQGKLLAKRVDDLWQHLYPGDRGHGIKVELPMPGFNWNYMRPINAHPNCVFLVDHTLAEAHIEEIQKDINKLAKLAAKLYPLTV